MPKGALPPMSGERAAARSGGWLDGFGDTLGGLFDSGGSEILGEAGSALGGLAGLGGGMIPSVSGSGAMASAGPSDAGDSQDSLGGGVYAPMNVGGGGGAAAAATSPNWTLIAIVGAVAWVIASR